MPSLNKTGHDGYWNNASCEHCSHCYLTVVKGCSPLTADEYRIDCNMLFLFVKQKRGVPEDELQKRDFSNADIDFIIYCGHKRKNNSDKSKKNRFYTGCMVEQRRHGATRPSVPEIFKVKGPFA